MKNLLTVTGKIVYDPERPGFNKTHKTRTMIIELPNDDLDLMYQWFIQRHTKSLITKPQTSHMIPKGDEHETWQKPFVRPGELVKMNRPMFGTHVTIVGGDENPKNMDAWKKHHGKTVTVNYAPIPRQHWSFWSLPVYSVFLQDYRRELGLGPERDFHITVGRIYDWQRVPPKARRFAWQIRKEMEAKGLGPVLL